MHLQTARRLTKHTISVGPMQACTHSQHPYVHFAGSGEDRRKPNTATSWGCERGTHPQQRSQREACQNTTSRSVRTSPLTAKQRRGDCQLPVREATRASAPLKLRIPFAHRSLTFYSRPPLCRKFVRSTPLDRKST